MVARSAELNIGRTFGLTMDDGDDFFSTLSAFCSERGITAGYIPMFIGAFRKARVVGTCHRADGEKPMFDSYVDVEFVEAVGAGTLAFDHGNNKLLPHVHLSVGKRLHGANGLTTHLFEAEIQFLLEMVVVEVTTPSMTRPINPNLYDIPLLTFG